MGLPNAGKSTLFNSLTGASVLAASHPFATIDPNTGVAPVPDLRIGVLADLFGSLKSTPATVTFVDIAGLVKGASQGAGLGNKFLANIREVNAICHVVRAFASASVAHVYDHLDQRRDIETVETELALADLEAIDKRLPRLEKEATADSGLVRQVALLKELREVVGSGQMVSNRPSLMARRVEFADLHLLTAKPTIYVFNTDQCAPGDENRLCIPPNLVKSSQSVLIDAQIEAGLTQLAEEDRLDTLTGLGMTEPGVNAVIRAAYDTLGLQSYLTGGPKEARAWTIRAGSTASQAAGVIHTAFERGFIAADVIDFDRLVEAGSWLDAKATGVMRTEGRDYVMRPGDVVEFKFNV